MDELNKVIELKREQLKQLDLLAQSIFYDMFGDPIANPKGWRIAKIGNISEVGSGGTPSKSISDYWNSKDIPWIGSNMCQNKFIYHTDGKFITYSGLDNSSAKLLDYTNGFEIQMIITHEQEEFINNILNYVCQNGDMEKHVFVNNRISRESLLKYFPNKAMQVAQFVALLHDAITAA